MCVPTCLSITLMPLAHHAKQHMVRLLAVLSHKPHCWFDRSQLSHFPCSTHQYHFSTFLGSTHTHTGLYLVIFPQTPAAQACTYHTVSSGTTGARLSATHTSPAPHTSLFPIPFWDVFHVTATYCS